MSNWCSATKQNIALLNIRPSMNDFFSLIIDIIAI